MGVNKGNEEHFSDMTFIECTKCNTVQIKEIIDPELLYLNNHNVSIVGDIWINHYKEFIEFLKPKIQKLDVLEIGDPSFKISDKLSVYSNIWSIVEMNINDELLIPKNTKVLNRYFDDNFTINSNVDVVVHSHFLEHVTDIIKHLKTVNNILNDNGRLIFSVPNLEKILLSDSSPNNVLHFEHTYFYTKESLIKIIQSEGFRFIDCYEYQGHSLFFHFQKGDVIKDKFIFDNVSNHFLESFEKYKIKVGEINERLNGCDMSVVLYGAHVSSQFLISLGLDVENINYIIDNSKDKIGYNLYGTKLKVKPVNQIISEKNVLIIVSHMSVYKDEIMNQIRNLKNDVEFI
jgi:predicted SAM-dependent methyltransferase